MSWNGRIRDNFPRLANDRGAVSAASRLGAARQPEQPACDPQARLCGSHNRCDPGGWPAGGAGTGLQRQVFWGTLSSVADNAFVDHLWIARRRPAAVMV